VLGQFSALIRAVRRKDKNSVEQITIESPRKMAYFDYLFNNFDTIEVRLTDVRASQQDQTIRASLQLTRMIRANGDIAFPATEFKKIPLHSVKTEGWSKIHW